MSLLTDLKVALVYDRVNKWGGAERILLELHKIFPSAPLYTSVYNPQSAPWAKDFDVKSSFLQNMPFARSTHEVYASLMPLAFESFSFDGYDLVISITSEAAKGIITSPKTMHICYCLTPTRYLWSGYRQYFQNDLLRFVSMPVVSYLRSWDKVAASRPDACIAISKEVQGRIKKYYERDATLIYPPVTLNTKCNFQKVTPKKGDYFLIVSRLVPYKRVDIAIEAANILKVPLKIVGIGREEQKLKKLAGPTIEFLGSLTDEELVGYYKGCVALLFPGEEDFGLTILEAQSFGKPVIAYKAGGAREIINEGKTGEFFFPQTSQALIGVIKSMQQKLYVAADCIANADLFNSTLFKEKFTKEVGKLLAQKL